MSAQSTQLLTFIDAVHRHFDPLARRHGLHFVHSTPRAVRFESEKVFMDVAFDSLRSYELRVDIGKRRISADEEKSFDLAEVMRLRRSPDAAYVAGLMASQPDAIAGVIERLAAFTEEHAKELLDGNAWDFARLAQFREKECRDYAQSHVLRHARSDAEKAWARKDYPNVVRSYASIAFHLTASELKRLSIAKRKGSEGQ